MRSIFPNLKIWVELADHSDSSSGRCPMQATQISVHRALSYSTFLRILRTPTPRTFWRKEPFAGRSVVHSVTFYASAYLYHLDSSNAGHDYVLHSDPRLWADVAFEEPSRLVVDTMSHALQVERDIDTFFGLVQLEARSRPTGIAGSTDFSSPAETRVLAEGGDGDHASRGLVLRGEGSSPLTLYVRQTHVDHIFANVSYSRPETQERALLIIPLFVVLDVLVVQEVPGHMALPSDPVLPVWVADRPHA